VLIDSSKCISDAVCVHLCPDVFELDKKHKAVIRELYRTKSVIQGIVPEELKECIEQTVKACPLRAISIRRVEDEENYVFVNP